MNLSIYQNININTKHDLIIIFDYNYIHIQMANSHKSIMYDYNLFKNACQK